MAANFAKLDKMCLVNVVLAMLIHRLIVLKILSAYLMRINQHYEKVLGERIRLRDD